MRRQVAAIALVSLLGACNIFGTPDVAPPFEGWFHTDRSARASSIQFLQGGTAQIRDYGCTGNLNVDTTWLLDDTGAVILNQWGGQPRFIQDPSTDAGQLLATPGVYLATTEAWVPGASCLVCADPDAGVAVACDTPGLRDAGP